MSKKKKTKEWKKCKKDYFDVDERDSPCLFTQGKIFIGNKGSTHATMVQEIFYGMDFVESDNYYDMYTKVWEEEAYIETAEERNTTIWYYRGNIEDKENYVFGHRLGNNLYWDMKDVSIETYKELLYACKKESQYKHFSYGDYYGGYIVKELKNYSHKTNLVIDK